MMMVVEGDTGSVSMMILRGAIFGGVEYVDDLDEFTASFELYIVSRDASSNRAEGLNL